MTGRGPLLLRHGVGTAIVVALVVGVLAVHLAARARGADAAPCARFAAAAADRAALVTGAGARVVVIGDSYAVGLGLAEPRDSWPTRLPGEVHVSGFSGSGFSRGASDCRSVSYAERAAAALRDDAGLVVVEGGLNDVDRPAAEIRTGYARLLSVLAGHRTVVVGPPPAPARAAAVPRVDRLLAALSAEHDVPYVSAVGWELPYLADGLHLTPDGHRRFGDLVAAALR